MSDEDSVNRSASPANPVSSQQRAACLCSMKGISAIL